jgi:hypothetical protein
METTEKRNMEMVITLCPRCYQDFGYIPNRVLLLVNRHKVDTCCYCNVKNGWDYLIIEKEGRGKQ